MKKQFLSRLSRWITASPPFSGSVISARDYCRNYFSTYAAPWVILREPETSQEVLPCGVGNKVSWKFINLLTREVPEAFVLTLPFGRTWGLNGAVITREEVLLRDLSREFGSRSVHSIQKRHRANKMVKLKGVTALLLTAGAATYYHWLFDILPRFYLLKTAGLLSEIDRFILPRIEPGFQEQTLKLLGIERSKILEVDDDAFYAESEILIVPSLPSYLGTVNKWATDFLNETFTRITLPEVHKGNKIYISRARASTRLLLNEKEIISFLTGLGFDIIESENYSFLEQVAIFQQASVVVAPHGSGLSNIAFCKPGTKVIELMSSDFLVPCFWIIANNNSLPYYYALHQGVDNYDFLPYWEGRPGDYVFPIPAIKSVLELAGEKINIV